MLVRPDLARRGERAALVLGIGVGVDEDDRERLRALRDAAACAAARTASTSTAVRIVPSASVRSSTSRRMSRSAIGVKSPHRPQVWRRSRRRISSTSRKPRVVMTPIFGAAPLQQRIGADRRAVDDRADAGDAAERAQAVEKARPPRRRAATAPWRCGTCRVAASKQNRSVNVPPTSTPTMTPRSAHALGLARSCAVAARSSVPSSPARRHSRAAPLARDIAEPHVASDASRLARRGSPKPPPPGVSSRTCWPRRILTSVTFETSGGVLLAVVGLIDEAVERRRLPPPFDAEAAETCRARRAGTRRRRRRPAPRSRRSRRARRDACPARRSPGRSAHCVNITG